MTSKPKSRAPVVKVTVKSEFLRITINGVLHLSFHLKEYVGLQSWKYGDYRFCIEYSFKTTTIETWYVSETLWKLILKGLEAIHLV
jgi:hypothetical protein